MALNLQNVPGKCINGMDDELLDFITAESNDRYIIELENCFHEELLHMEQNLPQLNKEDLEDLDKIESESIAVGTDAQTKRHALMFRNFLQQRQLCPDFERVPDRLLNDYLRLFYGNLRKNDDTFYSPSSLVCIRASIQRHLTSVTVNRTVNILHGDNFKRANGVLKGMVGKYLHSNQAKSSSYEAISESDMQKINEYFDRSSNKKIQEEVLFNLMFHFGMRGRENLRSLQKDTFTIETDDDGKEYVKIDKVMKYKNVKASLSQKEFRDHKNSRMYESTDKSKCPVEAFKIYIQLLPNKTKENSLFPLCIKNGFSENGVLGKDTLGNFMPNLSKNAKLHNRYTNHCVRVTVVSVLKSKGYSNEEVASITGHKNVTSVQRYARQLGNQSLQKMSRSLEEGKKNNEIEQIASTSFCSGSNTIIDVAEKRVQSLEDMEIVVKKKMKFTESLEPEMTTSKIINMHGPFNNCTINF